MTSGSGESASDLVAYVAFQVCVCVCFVCVCVCVCAFVCTCERVRMHRTNLNIAVVPQGSSFKVTKHTCD